jgi:16S rRNA (guanine527-N7)-methyltransferase
MFAELLRRKLAGICELSESQIVRLNAHYDLLTRWNRVLNLTRVRTLEESIERHYCESVFAAIHLPERSASIADVGSGAGFPGIPMAVVRPQFQVLLIESHRRKAAFLKEASRDLANVHVLSGRAEDVAECVDWVVSRGVRYSDIAVALKRLGRNAELLTGNVQAPELIGFQWRKPIHLPWGEQRYLWLGSNNVSRETEPANCFT